MKILDIRKLIEELEKVKNNLSKNQKHQVEAYGDLGQIIKELKEGLK